MNESMPIRERISAFYWNFEGRSLPMGVGCAHFGADARPTTVDADLRVLMRCYEAGFRYYDTSRTYHESEVSVGAFLKRIDRGSVFLATKSMYPFRSDPNAFARFRDNFEQSFERLQTDHIDLFQIHDTEHFACCEPEVIPFLLERQAEGRIDYIGIGTRSLNALTLALMSGHVDSVLSYINYSLLKRSAEDVIDLASARNAAFLNASVFHFGAIKHPDPMGVRGMQNGVNERTYHRAARFQALCREMNVDIVQASLQFPLFHPGIALTLNGIKSASNLESTMAAMRARIHPEQWARIRALQAEDPYVFVQDDLL